MILIWQNQKKWLNVTNADWSTKSFIWALVGSKSRDIYTAGVSEISMAFKTAGSEKSTERIARTVQMYFASSPIVYFYNNIKVNKTIWLML